MAMIDITGKRFGKLVAIQIAKKDKRGEYYWLCKCDCGNQKVVSSYKLRSGNTKSCGCFQREFRANGIRKTHGMTNSKLYTIWQNMKHRCNDPKNIMFQYYGGRGIRVCDEWLGGFEQFMEWAMKMGYQEGLSIERIDVNGDYSPANCKWITKKQQYLNRTDSHLLTAFGKTQTIKEWADESGIKYDTIERRVNQYGWDAEDAVTYRPYTKHP